MKDKWNLDDLDKINDILIGFDVGKDILCKRGLTEWREGTINQQEAVLVLGYERDEIEKAIKALSELKEKLSTK